MTTANVSDPGALPEWALLTLAVGFLAGACFYLYRLLFPKHVKAVYGYYDVENEAGHGLCMLAMTTMLAPHLLPIPFRVWSVILGAAALWFFVRALTWGKQVPGARWWGDWAHVGMLAGMGMMFTGANVPFLAVAQGAFWLWFSVYYVFETYRDSRARKPLYLGSDVSHLSMGVMMLAMTVAPGLFMAHMAM